MHKTESDKAAIKHLETLEKRAETMKARAVTYTQIGKANALQASARVLRGALKAQGIIN